MAKRIITALDLELAARLGKSEFVVEPGDVITDVAREKAAQLEIRLTSTPSKIETPPNSTPSKPAPQQENSTPLEYFKNELDQLKKEISHLKKDQANGVSVSTPGINTAAEADLVIKNGSLVIPRLGILKGDLEIVGRKIAAISTSGQARGRKTIDAAGLYVMPGVMDPHIHLGIFGELQDEMEKETASALIGGVTTAGCFLYSDASYFEYFPSFVETVERYSFIDIFPHLVITTPQQVEEIPAYIRDLNITSFKVYMCGIPGLIPHMNDDKILDVFEKVKDYPHVSISIHAENAHLVDRFTTQNRRRVEVDNDLLAWSETRPPLAEEEAVKRAVLLARRYGVSIYLVHLSARESVAVVRAAGKGGDTYSLYAETTSPYLTIDTDWNLGPRGKMTPPFRPPEHRAALWEGLREGTIDTVGTDNATITLSEKKVAQGMGEALPGYPALATHLPSLLHEGVNKGRIDLARLTETISLRPAEIFGLYPTKGSLLPGSDADVVIVDLKMRRTVDPLKLASRSDFSLFEGQELTGWPVFTLKSGEVVMQNGELPGAVKRKGMVIRRM